MYKDILYRYMHQVHAQIHFIQIHAPSLLAKKPSDFEDINRKHSGRRTSRQNDSDTFPLTSLRGGDGGVCVCGGGGGGADGKGGK